MSESSFISIQDVSKHFGSIVAVDGIDLEIDKGEFFALLGPSGCGKTTLLRMLAGFEIPSQGEIVIDAEEMSSVPPYHRPVNMVFQNYAIFPHMNVFQNIAFGLRKDRLPRQELEKRVSDALSLIKNFPVDNVKELRWQERWSRNPRCYCWMSRWERWIKICVNKCNLNYANYRKWLASLLCLSLMTRKKRLPWLTASP